jgi:hypothetical protein
LAQKALEKGKYYFVKASEYPELPIGIQELITRIIAREGRLDYLEDILQVQIRNWENTKKLGSEALEKELRFEIEEDIRDRIYRSFFSNLITTLKTYHSEERFPQDELPLPTLEAFRDTQKLLNFPWNALNATPYPNIYRFYLEFPLKGEKLQTILLIEDLLFYDAETPHIKSEYLFRNELLSRKNNLQHWVNTFRAEQNRLPSSQEWENFLKLNPQFSHEIPVKYFALNEIGIVEERWKSPLDLSYLQQGILLTQHLRIFLVQRCIFELQEKVSAFFQKEQHYPSPEDFEKWILADNRYRHPNPARTYKLTPEGKVVSAFRR